MKQLEKKNLFRIVVQCIVGAAFIGNVTQASAYDNPVFTKKFSEGSKNSININKRERAYNAKQWLSDQPEKLGLKSGTDISFKVLSTIKDTKGNTHVRLQPVISNIPVIGKHVLVELEGSSERVVSVRGKLKAEEKAAELSPLFYKEEAVQKVISTDKLKVNYGRVKPELVVYSSRSAGAVLAWRFLIESDYKTDLGSSIEYIVDAASNQVLFKGSTSFDLLQVKINNCSTQDAGSCQYDGSTAFYYDEDSEVDPDNESDENLKSVQKIFQNFKIVYNYFAGEKYGLDSYNDNGVEIRVLANYAETENGNVRKGTKASFASGTIVDLGDPGTFIFGVGDDSYFERLDSLDIVAHEYGHGLMIYNGSQLGTETSSLEAGALSESFSDIVGVLVEASELGESASSIWRIGEDVLAKDQPFAAIRRLENPDRSGMVSTGCCRIDKSPQGRYHTHDGLEARNTIHQMSGIPSHAFYLLAQPVGNTNKHALNNVLPAAYRNVEVDSIGLENAFDIWWDAFMVKNTLKGLGFAGARELTLLSAFEGSDNDELELRGVANAWAAVGVGSKHNEQADSCLSEPALDTNKEKVLKAYLAIYGRLGDVAGVDLLAPYLASTHSGDLYGFIDGFADSSEFTSRFGGMSNQELIAQTYLHVFGRDADQNEINAWINLLNGSEPNTDTIAKIQLKILEGALGTDLLALNYRMDIARHYYSQWGASELEGSALSIEELAKIIRPIKSAEAEASAKSVCGDVILIREALVASNSL